MSEVIQIYTDGACKGNPGRGGWGALVIVGDAERELFGGEASTTNNRMEMMAVIKALQTLDDNGSLVIHTDSQYVLKGMTEWLVGWRKRGWLTAAKKPVKNVDLWKTMADLVDRFHVKWVWVRGHAGNPGNERADALANRGVFESSS